MSLWEGQDLARESKILQKGPGQYKEMRIFRKHLGSPKRPKEANHAAHISFLFRGPGLNVCIELQNSDVMTFKSDSK